MRPFHLAFPVHNLQSIREFYVDLLGCKVGRETDHWIDFDFFGHQLTAHKVDNVTTTSGSNTIDGDPVNVPHFGIVLEKSDWEKLADKLKQSHVTFQIPPKTRFKGEVGEQSTFFIKDPSGNSLEFKSVPSDEELFRPYEGGEG